MLSGTETQGERKGVSRGKVNGFTRSLHFVVLSFEKHCCCLGCSTRGELLCEEQVPRVILHTSVLQFSIGEVTQELECSFLPVSSDFLEI